MIKLVKTFTYNGRDCSICKVTDGLTQWLTAYVHLPELTEYYEDEMTRVPDYIDRVEEPLDDYLFNAPFVSFIGMFDSTKVVGYDHEVVSDKVFSVGLDLAHLQYLKLNGEMSIDLAESQLKEIVDFIEDNYKEIEKIVKGYKE